MSENAMEAMEALQQELPGFMQAFMSTHDEVFSEGTLSVKVKRLIMVGASVAIRCEPCIRVHTRAALEAGASREEILEAASAGILMGGGPSAAYTALYLRDELDAAGKA